MKEFIVNNNPGPSYNMFGFNHIFSILLAVIPMILIYIFRDKISKIDEKKSRKILVILATIMLVSQVFYLVTNIAYGIFDYKIHLPFHLCFISNYIFIYAIYAKKDNLLKYTFFLSFIGPIPAMLWPELPSSWDYFKFYEYFISHHVFIVASFFSYFALNYKIELKHIIKSAIFVNILIFGMMPFNIIFDMNYIYSSEIPAYIVNIYPFLKFFNPLLTIEVTGIVIATILYQLIRKRNKELQDVNIKNKVMTKKK